MLIHHPTSTNREASTATASAHPRIPLSFQAIFIQGNRGIDIHKPPPELSKNWWRQLLSPSSSPQKRERKVVVKNECKVSRSEKVSTNKPKPIPTLSPQQYLDGLVKSRGYSNASHPALASAYHNKPTPLQLASYGVHVVNLIRNNDVNGIQKLLSVGVSPNACNVHGESIVQKVCRQANNNDTKLLDVLLNAGCEIRICDNNGRTPLHHACWASEPNFALIGQLLERDIQLLYIADQHGHLPLSYTRNEHWTDWLQFLQSKKDVYWPRIVIGKDSCKNNETVPPITLLGMKPDSRAIADTSRGMSLQLVTMVANGKIKPEEAEFLNNNPLTSDDDDEDSVDSEDYTDSTSDFDGDDDDFDDSSTTSRDFDDDIDIDDNASITISDTMFTEKLPVSDHDHDDSQLWSDMDRVLQAFTSPIRRPIEW